MREIKFRAWIFQENRMTDVLDIEFRHNRIRVDHSDMDGSHAFYSNIGNKKLRYELMQYTGLTDKNGKEVYEGDCPGGIFEGSYIGWCEECKSLQLMINNIKDYGPCQHCEGDITWLDFIEDTIEIIGNIYENPELMEGK